MYAIFALARSLRPGHGAATAALPSPAGAAGHSQGGKEAGGSRAAPDVTGVADERRPPLRRPPRPCPSPRSCSRGRGRGRAGAAPLGLPVLLPLPPVAVLLPPPPPLAPPLL